MPKRGRTELFSNGRNIAEALMEINQGNVEEISYYHRQQLIERGYVDQEDQERQNQQRGRSRKLFKVSTKGKRILSLSKAWAKTAGSSSARA